MKTYTLKTLLMFFENQVLTDFSSIKDIVSKINSSTDDENSIQEAREFIYKTLREVGMMEEGFEEVSACKTTIVEDEIVMQPGTRESLAVFEQFEIERDEKIIHLIINLN
jgi:hypothetical protein